MKKPTFIIISIITIIILLGVWVYVLFYGQSPSQKDQFSDLNIGDQTDVIDQETAEQDQESPYVDVSGGKLRQLTTRQTAGFQEVQENASSTPKLLYVEAGTGNVFSIDLTSGEEKRISATTVPHSSRAVITPDGSYVMIEAGQGTKRAVVIGEIHQNTNQLTLVNLTENIVDFSVTTNNTFLYTTPNQAGLEIKQYYPRSGTSESIIVIPFREATVAWGREATDTHYIYPKASGQLEGFVYRAKNNTLTRLAISGFGLAASGNENFLIFAKLVDGHYQSYTYNHTTNQSQSFPFSFLPGKCIPDKESLVCALSFEDYNNNLPDTWLQGLRFSNDSLWRINYGTNGPESSLLAKLDDLTGRDIDVTRLLPNQGGDALYFSNRADDTIWSLATETAL